MAENFREFNPGNSSENERNNAQNRTSRSGGGFYGKMITIIACLLLLAVLALESVYSIGEQEQGVVTTFGHAGSVVTSGLHFKIPFVQRVTKVNTTILGFPIGYRSADDDSASQEQMDDESLMITSDFNFVNVDFYVEYKVSDPVKYLYNSQQPKEILKNIAQSCIRNIISNYAVDDVITTGKSKIQAEIKDMIIEKLEEQDIGLMLVNISMQDAEPPTEDVIEAFKAVETAKQGKETAINNANKYRNEKLPEANAKADQITQEAEAAKQERVNEGIAQAARFNEMYAEYEKNPLLTKQRMFYEAMEEVLPGVKLIIDDGSGSLNKTLYLDELQLEDITGEKSAASANDTGTQEEQ
ncbi:MAG: FtsH protease activity modulator HflK [Lachnospiraceae bacterium]|nr:FtsH protease activity modulator HflK [Lachnospiraceae bacterium]MDE7271743.1 FtsH protease activity modulator HflK [Lachnospiraceae bacterium]